MSAGCVYCCGGDKLWLGGGELLWTDAMTRSSFTFAAVEFYADEAKAIIALGLRPVERRAAVPALPNWATAPEVMDVGEVTWLRPDDTAIRDMVARPGLRYRDLVRHYGRDRLVLDFAALHPFGHPFHDDIFAILRELGRVDGRLAICNAGAWYVACLRLYRSIRVIVDPSGVPADAGP